MAIVFKYRFVILVVETIRWNLFGIYLERRRNSGVWFSRYKFEHLFVEEFYFDMLMSLEFERNIRYILWRNTPTVVFICSNIDSKIVRWVLYSGVFLFFSFFFLSLFTAMRKSVLFLLWKVRLNLHWKFHLYFGYNVRIDSLMWMYFIGLYSDFSLWLPSLWAWCCSWIFCQDRSLMGPGCRTGWGWWVVWETFCSTFWP